MTVAAGGRDPFREAALARIVLIDGTPLYVRSEGRGPVCVLSGGLGSSWFDWDAVTALLAPHRTVVRFDRPGYGLSAPARFVPTAAREAERIRQVLDALGLPGRCTVAGHSLAGFHAETFARLHPERTAGLVLLDSSVETGPRPRPAPGLRDLTARALAQAARALAIPYLFGPVGRRTVARMSTVRRADPAPVELVRRCYRPSRALRAALRENAAYLDVAAQLAELRHRAPLPPVPVTVLAADDGGGSRRNRRWLQAQRSLADLLGAEFRTVAPVGHLLMFDRPDAVAAAILAARSPA
ncbi:alpha/beta hydrolase [Kitasatospora sp. GP82]|uniref:alpha/beta fold hydrolase n=1 Tax=Kitasatospora sp. GP82 TaxID=3035089 RepID=UPI0024761D10|nr:alpha/beta hydrolase [Kitasatospora sp. GP82]MDH6126591.1 pimeloyl-ACP methyl ester carboxylesterase [Kitasatospora sp. GP82]